MPGTCWNFQPCRNLIFNDFFLQKQWKFFKKSPRNLCQMMITYHNLSALQIGICFFGLFFFFFFLNIFFSFSFLFFSVLLFCFLFFFFCFFLFSLFLFFFFYFLYFSISSIHSGQMEPSPLPSRLPKKLLQRARCGNSMADRHLEACLAPPRTR